MSAREAPPTARLWQRERELAELRDALAAAADGRATVTLVAGAAGTGKSSLLAAATAELGPKPFVRRARGSELERELPFGVVRQLLEAPMRSLPANERRRLLSGAAAPAERLFVEQPHGGGGGDGGFATLNGLYWLLAGMAASRPLALMVDDVHWADADSVRALAYLAGRLDDLPIALVVAVRSNEPGAAAGLLAALEGDPRARRLDLHELEAHATAELVRSFLPDANDPLCAAFHESTGGNPFYLRELLRAVGSRRDGALSADDVRSAAVTTVGDRVRARVEALGPDATPLAESMAVLGMSGPLRIAAAVAGLDEDAAASLADRMSRAEILAGADPFEWIHPLVQRSLYDGLTVTRRDDLHAQAASAFEDSRAGPGIIAAHLAARRPERSPHVVSSLLRAADDAIARDAPEEAGSLVRRAIGEDAAEPSRAALLLRLGQIDVTRRDPAAAVHLREALDLLTDPRDRALAAMSLGEILVHAGDWDAAAQLIRDARAELGGADPELNLELDVSHALVCAFDPKLAAGFWRDRSRLVELASGESWAAHALCALLAATSAFRGEHLDEIVPLVERATGDGLLFAQRGAGAWTPAHVLAALALVEQHERADEVADDVSAAARAQGSVASALTAESQRGWSAARLGDLAAAEELLRPVEDTAHTNGMLLVLVNVLWFGRDLLVERASQADMAAVLESIDLPPAFEEAAGGAWVKAARGRVRIARGDLAGGVRDLRAAGGIYDRLGFGPLHDPWRSALALALPAGAADEALALVDAELEDAHRTGLARPLGVALRAKGLLAGGDDGVELLRESVAVLAGSPARFEHAQSIGALGAALRRGGRRADARAPLADGLEQAFRCGAERLVEHARAELIAAGARRAPDRPERVRRPHRVGAPRRPPSPARDARTPTSRRSCT